MKTFSKLMLLMALVVGGKLSKSSDPAAVASQAPKPLGTEVLVASYREASRPVQPHNQPHTKPAQTQVLSVFLK